jgi:hypothetical protein
MIDDLVDAQMTCLADEPRANSACAPAYSLVRRHFRHCVAWNFPASFPSTLDRLLMSSRGGWDAPVALWHEFLSALLGANQIRTPPGGIDVGIETWCGVWRTFAQQQTGMDLSLILGQFLFHIDFCKDQL